MKKKRVPTLKQSDFMAYHGLDPKDWYVIKNMPHQMEVFNEITGEYKVLPREKAS